jgi:hypothetical protein
MEEEVNTWVRQLGSLNVHASTMTCLQALDGNAGAIAKAMERLRS